MIKPILCEGCSVLIALVLVVADCRHLTAAASEPVAPASNQIAPDARHILQIDFQSRNATPGMTSATGNDLVRQLSGLSAMYTARVGHQPAR
jgi:hypothetical protein